MATKAELEREVKELKQTVTSLQGELSTLFTKILTLAIQHNYTKIIAYLNPFPQEIQKRLATHDT